MRITKALFVDYMSFPKLARWKVNSPDKYKKIKHIESDEDQEKIVSLGQTVENAVKQYLEAKHQTSCLNLFHDIQVDGNDEDSDSFDQIEASGDYFKDLHAACDRTIIAIQEGKPLLYQPSFFINDATDPANNCFVRADFMLANTSGSYDLLEVKAKTTIRNNVKHNGEDTPLGEVKKELIYDISFQSYVINKTLTNNGLAPLGKKYIIHLNKECIKDGELDIMQLIKEDEVGITKTISILQGKADNPKEVSKNINDSLLSDEIIEGMVQQIKNDMILTEKEFNAINPFPGNKYLEYFAEERPFGTIMGRGINHTSANTISDFYYQNKINIADLSEDEIECFRAKTAGPDGGSSLIFINKYLTALDGHNPLVDEEHIKEFFGQFTSPLCFYDYETISVPIPFMDKTYPYQQVVVQYSLHKYYPDGTIKHYGGILEGMGEKKVKTIEITDNMNRVDYESEKVVTGSYRDLMEEFLNDIGNDLKTASFIVWNKGFENARNKEVGKLFPEFLDALLTVNEKTYDLMDIVKKGRYFDLGCEGSASIKKVLPVLVPDMSYKGLAVENGSIAMNELFSLISSGGSDDSDTRLQKITDLLLYCGQDSLAMLRIWEAVRRKVK